MCTFYTQMISYVRHIFLQGLFDDLDLFIVMVSI